MRTEEKSLKKLISFFFEIENKYSLLNRKVKGVYVWQYIRMPLYYQLATKVKIIEKPHQLEKTNIFNIVFDRVKFIFHSILSVKSLIRLRSKYKVVILEHDRYTPVDGHNVDIYTYNYRKKIAIENKVLSFRFPLGINYRKSDVINDYIDLSWLLLAGAIAPKFMRSIACDANVNVFNEIQAEIKKQFGVDFDLVSYISKYTNRYIFREKIIRYILKTVGAERFDIVTPYSGRGDFVGAARNLGLPVKEIQHGIISKYHLGYHFPYGSLSSDHILPDLISLWGAEWNLGAIFHSRINTVFGDVDYPHIEKISKIYSTNSRIVSGNITIVSQGAISEKIASFILNNMRKLESYNIYYKLHPSEIGGCNQYIKSLSKYKNVTIIYQGDVIDLFSKSQFVIGVFSTALIEAKLCGCKVIILPFSGSEYFENESGYYEFGKIFY